MKSGTENMNKNKEKNIFYKTNPSGGISLIVLVITIIVVIILAAAVIISLQNNNPMVEANKARINSDVANMQAIFTNTVGKMMAENQDVVEIEDVQLNSVTSGKRKTTGETTYKIVGTDGTPVVQGRIKFSTEKSEGTIYCTGKELPLYGSDTKWYVDNQGLISVEVGGVTYGEGANINNPPSINLKEEIEITASENPMIKRCWNSSEDFRGPEYRTKITKIKLTLTDKVPGNRIKEWDISNAQDKSVMAWIEDDGNDGYILIIAGKNKIIANTNSIYLFASLIKVEKIENLELLDTSKVIIMSCMFSDCKSLIELNLSNFDTNNVTNMQSMFSECQSLISLDLRSFTTSSVTNMGSMFYRCNNLESINLNTFDTSNVDIIMNMFCNCNSLTNLELNGFDTSSVTNIYSMFANCNKLTTTITIRNKNLQEFREVFSNSATVSPAQITVNYTEETSSLVDNMIATKSSNSNVVKGTLIN